MVVAKVTAVGASRHELGELGGACAACWAQGRAKEPKAPSQALCAGRSPLVAKADSSSDYHWLHQWQSPFGARETQRVLSCLEFTTGSV